MMVLPIGTSSWKSRWKLGEPPNSNMQRNMAMPVIGSSKTVTVAAPRNSGERAGQSMTSHELRIPSEAALIPVIMIQYSMRCGHSAASVS